MHLNWWITVSLLSVVQIKYQYIYFQGHSDGEGESVGGGISVTTYGVKMTPQRLLNLVHNEY